MLATHGQEENIAEEQKAEGVAQDQVNRPGTLVGESSTEHMLDGAGPRRRAR